MPARGDIGGNEDVDLAVTKALDGAIALALALVAPPVDRGRVESVGDQPGHQLFRPMLGAGKKTSVSASGSRDRIFAQHLGLVALFHVAHRLRDLVGPPCPVARPEPCAGSSGRRATALPSASAWWPKNSMVWRGVPQLGRDPTQRVDEAEVEHLVGLVEHQVTGLAQVHRAAIHQVDQPAGRGHQNVGLPRAITPIWRLIGLAADDRGDLGWGVLIVKDPQRVRDLVHQARASAQGSARGSSASGDGYLLPSDARSAAGRRPASCRCRSGPGPGCRGRPSPAGIRLVLDRGGGVEAASLERVQQNLVQAEHVEIKQIVSFRAPRPTQCAANRGPCMECTAFEGATGPLIGAIVRTLREWDLGNSAVAVRCAVWSAPRLLTRQRGDMKGTCGLRGHKSSLATLFPLPAASFMCRPSITPKDQGLWDTESSSRGATGNVGREMLNILAEREFPRRRDRGACQPQVAGQRMQLWRQDTQDQGSGYLRLHRMGHRAVRHRLRGDGRSTRPAPPRPAAS